MSSVTATSELWKGKKVCVTVCYFPIRNENEFAVLDSLRPYLVITVPATGDLTDPGSFLWKINPRFRVWTHFNIVLLLQAYLKVEYPKKYSQSQIIPGIIQQAVMPADHRDKLFSARTRCKILVLTTKSFPDELLVWAQRQLLQFTFLPSSLQHPPGAK